MVTVQIVNPATYESYTKTGDDVVSSASSSSLELLYLNPKNDDIKKALQILDAKEWMNVEQFLNPWGADRVTLVHLAAYRGNLKVLQRASDLKADFFAVDKFGKCALHYAAGQGHVDVIRWLLEHFAVVVGLNGTETSAHPQLSLPDVFGNTPLHEAIKGRHTSVVKLLVYAGCNVDAQNEKLHTPLILAGVNPGECDLNGKSWYEEIVEILVGALASVNACDPVTGATPLHYAVALNSYGATKSLLDAGARLDVKDKQGCTPLYTAANGGHLKCVRLLIDNGGNLATETNDGKTVMEALLKYGTRATTLFTDVLNSGVHAKPKSDDVIVDFGVLAPQSELQMAVISGLIQAIPTLEKIDILQHPLLEVFLRLKWTRFRYLYFLLLAVQYFFVGILIAYTIMLKDMEYEPPLLRRTLLACACLLLFNNLMQILVVPRHYRKKFQTWLSVICSMVSASIILAGDFLPEKIITDADPVKDNSELLDFTWLLELTGIIIPLAVIQVQLTVAQNSEIGKYVFAFINVFKKFLMVLRQCTSLVGSSCLGFLMLFGGSTHLLGTWNAIKKLFGVAFGDEDFTEILFAAKKMALMAQLIDTIRAAYLIVILLASITLINFILGLAISNVHEFVREGRNCQLKNQAEFLIYCERLTSGWIFRNRWLPNCLKKLLSTNIIDTRLELEWAKVYSKPPRGISKNLLDRLFNLGFNKS